MKKYYLKVSEWFKGIQGEGRWISHPGVFLRLSGCTRCCKYCDTKYHKIGKSISVEKIAKFICSQPLRRIIISGGEPLLQWEGLVELWKQLRKEKHFIFDIETNGDLLYQGKVPYSELFSVFDYVAISPKEVKVARKLYDSLSGPLSKGMCDIKVVTDLKSIGIRTLKYATVLMPLTTCNEKADVSIRKRVWKYCVDNGIRYSPRLHIEIFGYTCRGV